MLYTEWFTKDATSLPFLRSAYNFKNKWNTDAEAFCVNSGKSKCKN